ncbi:YhcN/YlaJ family sporulation lipoprotein [Ammoniphilus sp. YIM 78166]|uniref:YhcN/YlaJ family sporulation lipoprotein n=1 Tax=Ammoniphilus sp. YIM 78166 TaxID=1644106 RepID=UPI001430F742|nr:YhcN/YlaJ family sporulation lipoprotein [Ammoniphilus sp. YIM 78166]
MLGLKVHSLLLCALVFTLAGCQAGTAPDGARTQAESTRGAYQQIGYNSVLSTHVEAVSQQVNGVDEAVSVVMGKDVSVALRVSGIDRFRLKGIKKEVSTKLKRDLSDRYTIHVTTDKKLFRDLVNIQGKLNHGQGKPKELMKTYKKINDDMHG